MEQSSQNINFYSNFINNGAIGLLPIQGVWGLVCDANNEDAINKIFDIKRSKNLNSFSLILTEENELKTYFDQPNLKIIDYIIGVGKPQIVIYNKAKNISSNVIKKDGSLAAQIITQTNICSAIKKQCDKPLLYTVARFANNLVPTSLDKVDPKFKEFVSFIAHEFDDEDINAKKTLSTIKWHNDGSIQIIRR